MCSMKDYKLSVCCATLCCIEMNNYPDALKMALYLLTLQCLKTLVKREVVFFLNKPYNKDSYDHI